MKQYCFHLLLFVFFSLGLAIFLAFAGEYFPPKPVIDFAGEHLEDPLIEMETGETLSIEFPAPAAGIDRVHVHYLLTDGKGEFVVRVENLTRGALLAEEVLGMGFLETISFEPGNHRGDRIKLSYTVAKSQQDRLPAIRQGVKRARVSPHGEFRLERGSRELTGSEVAEGELWPSFKLDYSHPLRSLRYLWVLPLAFFPLVLVTVAHRGKTAGYLLLLGAGCFGLSLNIYFHRYVNEWPYADPDEYAAYGENLHLAMQPAPGAEGDQAREMIDQFPHAQAPLTPLVIFCARMFGANTLPAYVWWASINSFAFLLLIHGFLRRNLGVSSAVALTAVTLAAFHVIFLRAFGKASTDPSGLLMVSLGLVFVYARFVNRVTWRGQVWFGVLLVLVALSRPAGLASAVALAGIATLPLLRSPDHSLAVFRTFSLTGAPILLPFAFFGMSPFLATAVTLCVIGFYSHQESLAFRPAKLGLAAAPFVILGLVWAGCYFAFDWADNLETGFAKAKHYSVDRDAYHLFTAFASNAYPLILLGLTFPIGRWRGHPIVWVCLLWMLAHLAILFVFGAPLYNRLMLPILISVVLIVAVALEQARQIARWRFFAAGGAVLLLSIASVFCKHWSMQFPGAPPEAYVRWIFF